MSRIRMFAASALFVVAVPGTSPDGGRLRFSQLAGAHVGFVSPRATPARLGVAAAAPAGDAAAMRWHPVLLAVAGVVVTACGACSSHDTETPDAPAGACAGEAISAGGDGTYYDATGAGNCSFDPSPGDLMVAALNAPDYANAAWCGACVAVSGPSGDVVVRIVDQCPECKHGDLDLSREAFAKIAPLSAGRVAISWHEVACPVTGPIVYQIKDGSNAFWTAIQVRNHRYAIDKLEVRGGGGNYQPVARLDYNYFVAPNGLGAGPYALRVTDVHGHVLEDGAVQLGDAVSRPGADQFPACR